MTTAIADVAHAWTDPEFWGPPGLGCARCHERPPIVWGLPFVTGALCLDCLSRCFNGWDFDRLVGWLVRQKEGYIRKCARAAAWAAYNNGHPELMYKYREKYGLDGLAQ